MIIWRSIRSSFALALSYYISNLEPSTLTVSQRWTFTIDPSDMGGDYETYSGDPL